MLGVKVIGGASSPSVPSESMGGIGLTRPSKAGQFRATRTTLGLVLLGAAALKLVQFFEEPASSEALSSSWLTVALLEFELFLGLWHLVGIAPRMLWRASLTCFSCFTAVSLFQGLSGATSCGCFGRISPNPWIMFILDAMAVLALLYSGVPIPRRTAPPAAKVRLKVIIVSTLLLLLAAPAGVSMVRWDTGMLAPNGRIVGKHAFVVLDPSEWVGRSFPLVHYVDRKIASKLSAGAWFVVFYRRDCERCHSAVLQYNALARDLRREPNGMQVAFLCLASVGNGKSVRLG